MGRNNGKIRGSGSSVSIEEVVVVAEGEEVITRLLTDEAMVSKVAVLVTVTNVKAELVTKPVMPKER